MYIIIQRAHIHTYTQPDNDRMTDLIEESRNNLLDQFLLVGQQMIPTAIGQMLGQFDNHTGITLYVCTVHNKYWEYSVYSI